MTDNDRLPALNWAIVFIAFMIMCVTLSYLAKGIGLTIHWLVSMWPYLLTVVSGTADFAAKVLPVIVFMIAGVMILWLYNKFATWARDKMLPPRGDE